MSTHPGVTRILCPPHPSPAVSYTPISIHYLPAVVERRDDDGDDCQRHLGAGLAQLLQVGERFGHAAVGQVFSDQAHSCGAREAASCLTESQVQQCIRPRLQLRGGWPQRGSSDFKGDRKGEQGRCLTC